jgi:Bacterial alpha-L-rhamnosidase C-terminal domain
MQEDLLGVNVTAPGASRIEIRTPAVTPMRMSGVAVTQRGRVPISWERAGPGRFSLDVTIPANVEATIHIPAPSVAAVSDGHAALAADPGVSGAREFGREVIVTAGSGHYEFRVPALAIRAAPASSGSSSSGALVGGIVAIAVLAIAASGVILARKRRGTVAKA